MPQVINQPSGKFNGDADPRVVILHHTGGSEDSDIATLWGSAEVSIHAYITKDGRIYLGVPLGKRAWHAGSPSYWNGLTDINSYSIGVELENMGDGSDPFTDVQLKALDYFLVAIVRPLYGNLPIARHRDILAGKVDPADNFPWDRYVGGIAEVLKRSVVSGADLQEDDDMKLKLMAFGGPGADKNISWLVNFNTMTKMRLVSMDEINWFKTMGAEEVSGPQPHGELFKEIPRP